MESCDDDEHGFTIVCRNATEVHVSAAHASIAIANCDFFFSVFAHGMRESSNRIIAKPDWSEATTVQFISLLVEKKAKSDSIKEYLELLDACEQMLTLVEIRNPFGIVCGDGPTNVGSLKYSTIELADSILARSTYKWRLDFVSKLSFDTYQSLLDEGIAISTNQDGFRLSLVEPKDEDDHDASNNDYFGFPLIEPKEEDDHGTGGTVEGADMDLINWLKRLPKYVPEPVTTHIAPYGHGPVGKGCVASNHCQHQSAFHRVFLAFCSTRACRVRAAPWPRWHHSKETISLRIPMQPMTSRAAASSFGEAAREPVRQFLFQALASRFGGTKSVDCYNHDKSSLGFYLDGSNSNSCPTFTGTFKQLKEVLDVLNVDEIVTHRDRRDKTKSCKRCSLRVSFPTDATMDRLVKASQYCIQNPNTLGADFYANALYAIKEVSDMKALLAALVRDKHEELPPSGSFTLVELTLPKGVF